MGTRLLLLPSLAHLSLDPTATSPAGVLNHCPPGTGSSAPPPGGLSAWVWSHLAPRGSREGYSQAGGRKRLGLLPGRWPGEYRSLWNWGCLEDSLAALTPALHSVTEAAP
ncbi:unnamed protein product [Rangifer tarandus platyrhynchus]|uniref:Uncharacterized protein n=2 Tax=Rangifer tarandus platyrhynchus TaxID=3082113 RepID=A0ABN8Y700_RANTA|nr:unnamed protein product [Rangifer tarandus platyrhynchus]